MFGRYTCTPGWIASLGQHPELALPKLHDDVDMQEINQLNGKDLPSVVLMRMRKKQYKTYI